MDPSTRSRSTGRMPLALLAPLALLLAVLVLGLCAFVVVSAPAEAARGVNLNKLPDDLPERYRAWLEEVRLLLTKEELATFLEIPKDYQRDAFIERFWRIRDPFPDTARNEFREKWEVRVGEVYDALNGEFRGERAEILLLNGFPDALIDLSCAEIVSSQVWFYQRAETVGHEVVLLFYQPGGLGRYRLWHPVDGFDVLLRFPGDVRNYRELATTCRPGQDEALLAALGYAGSQGLGFPLIAAGVSTPGEGPSGEWAQTFGAYTTEVPDGAETFEADLELDFPGRHKTRTVIQGVLSLDRDDLAVSKLGEHESYNLVLIGEVLRDDKLFDSFRYTFNHPLATVEDARLPLIFERLLRPGEYRMILRLEDSNAPSFMRREVELDVPAVESAYRMPAPDEETERILAEANAAISSGEISLRIVPPRDGIQTGQLRVDTLAIGDAIDTVRFALDGQHVLIKKQPPYSVELDLGTLPKMRDLVATAFDADGNELARDELLLNSGSHRFAARLIEPRRGRRYARSLRAEAEVLVPDGRVIERVEFFLNENLVATLYQEPYTHPIVLPDADQVAYVRVVAYQPDGNSTEDLVFVNAPEYLEELDVQFVELYIAVLDKNQRPIDGLGETDFSILENGAEQSPMRFERVRNLPIHAGILLDVSASMASRLDTAQQAALRFFQEAITPKDRAALITFNDYPHLASKFTNDLGVLSGGLAGLRAERGTALYDSIIFALYYFNGIKGQRALILLSDGKDEHSRFSFDNTLEYARRAGVSIYSIGLNLTRKQQGDTAKKLRLLSEETGGRIFLIDDVNQLGSVYAEIQRELRSRYYIAYQSTNSTPSREFRSIEVELAKADLEAKTLRGYYP